MKVFLEVLLFSSIVLSSCHNSANNFMLAKKELEVKDFLGAIIRLNMHMKKEGANDSTLALRGFCYQSIWKDSLAKLDFHRAISLNPENYFAKLSLGKLYFNEDSIQNAERQFISVATNAGYKEKSEAYIELGRIKYFHNDFAEALSAFTKAINSDSSNAMAWYYRALLRSRFFTPNGLTEDLSSSYPFLDFEKAESDLNTCIELMPILADAYFQRAMVHFNRFDDENGMKDINQAIELAPAYIYYYIGRAHQHLLMERFDLAISDLDHAISKNPNESSAYAERSVVYSTLGKNKQAYQDSLKAEFLKNKKAP